MIRSSPAQDPHNPDTILVHNPPYRAREKHRGPQTRRRRENTVGCLDKLRTIRDNLMGAMEVAEMLVLREKKKREMLVSGGHLGGTARCKWGIHRVTVLR